MSNERENESEFQRKCAEFVEREVYYCVSNLVHTLATSAGHDMPKELAEICEEAQEAFTPTVTHDDRVEALESAGYSVTQIEEGQALPWTAEEEGGPTLATESNAGWYVHDSDSAEVGPCDSAEEATEEGCDNIRGIDPQEFAGEIYEHWIVSGYLARRLQDAGHGAVLVEKRTVILRRKEYWGQALGSIGASLTPNGDIDDNGRILPKDSSAFRHCLAHALNSYGCHDLEQSAVYQLERDGPMTFDGWRADKRLRANANLERLVRREFLRS